MLILAIAVSAFGMICASVHRQPGLSPKPPAGRPLHPAEAAQVEEDDDDNVKLIHADVLYKRSDDPRADVLVGNVRLYHAGMFLDCDSARFYKDNNTFNSYGNVKMVQGDTLTLTSDTLLYDGVAMQAHAMGNAVLIHRETKLTTELLDYDRIGGVGYYPRHGVLYDEDNVLNSDYGQYTPATREAIFRDNVVLDNPKFRLITNILYYFTDTKFAQIVDSANIITSDSTFIYTTRGDYDTQTGQANLLDRSHIYKDMRDIVGDSIFCDRERGFSEAFGNVVLTDVENQCLLTGNYCRYDDSIHTAVATDSAVFHECSSPDTLYVHGDTLKMIAYNVGTDSVYRDMFAYHRVRMFRRDVQGVCDSLASHELESCTYLYGQPILWNEGQQVVGEEMRIFNNDSTIDSIHVINQAMTVERLDSVSYNQVSSKLMFCYFKDGVLERNHARGNVYVDYFMTESDSTLIGMNYTETTELITYMRDKRLYKIWMPAAVSTMYPPFAIPPEKRYLVGFAWFEYIRPRDKDDIFEWRSKSKETMLKRTERRVVPIQRLDNIK